MPLRAGGSFEALTSDRVSDAAPRIGVRGEPPGGLIAL
jgi:hypothetical protein